MSYGSIQEEKRPRTPLSISERNESLSTLVNKWEQIEIGEIEDKDHDQEFWEEWEKMTERRWVPCSKAVGVLVWLGDLGVFQFGLLLGVLCLAGFFFSLIESEQSLTFIDSVYWGAVTVATIGYGDIVPRTASGKIYTVFFALLVIPYYFFVSSVLWTSMAVFADWGMRKILGVPIKQKSIINEPHSYQFLIRMAPFIFALLCFFASTFIGAVLFVLIEGWDSYWEGVYFCFITQSTIGYGDRVVVTPAGRIVLVFYSFWNITTMGALITSFQSILRTNRHQRKLFIKQELSKQLKSLLDRLEEESRQEAEQDSSPFENYFFWGKFDGEEGKNSV